jgi:hypothetical protein
MTGLVMTRFSMGPFAKIRPMLERSFAATPLVV